MTTIDQRFIYLQNAYNEYKLLFDNNQLNEVEYSLYIQKIEETARSIWGTEKIFYDYIALESRKSSNNIINQKKEQNELASN